MSEGLNRLEQLFHDALALASTEERAEYLARACGPDTALRERVKKLLRAHSTCGQFLSPDTPVPTALPESELDAASPEKPGDQIGHYSLVERIGEGGCCVVYLAEQTRPLRRQVALKLIKAGMDTRQVVARFEAERQALALMDHPNIAKVFEAGVCITGRPYFVMELVRGIPINRFCDANQLSIKQRLELFMQVAHAVQHAHQKGIIHRDLKPSNILVTSGDSDGPLTASSAARAEGVPAQVEANRSPPAQSSAKHHQPLPKIIDFGIAKAMQPGLTDRALATWFGQFVGTPAYMSPEQAEMRNEDIDARSDIYSLGALLYELLTGVTPFDSAALAAARFDEILRRIQETDPPKPSARLAGLGEKLAELAEARQANHVAWRRSLQGDLDWIVMKALEKDRQRRYATANDLAEDIQRHLANEPVLAGPPGAAYRTGKFVRRHRVAVGVSVVITLALILGLSLALAGLHRAVKAEAASRRERDRALQAEQEMRRDRDRAMQAEKDTKTVLALFSDESVLDSKRTALHYSAAQLARERLGPTNPAVLNFIMPLAGNLGRQGAWTNALEVYSWLAEAYPSRCDILTRTYAAALAAGEPLESRQILDQVVSRFGNVPDPIPAMQVARAVLIRRDGKEHLKTGLDCARRAMRALPNDPWCQAVQGMADYRRGDWSAALKAVAQPENDPNPFLAALASCFGAMARHRAGQAAAARAMLGRARRELRPCLVPGLFPAGKWDSAVFALVARAEAERLILGVETSPPVTSGSLSRARENWSLLYHLLDQGELLAREAKWKESREFYARALAHPSFDWEVAQEASPMRCLSLQMGTVFVRSGDRTNYERLCGLLLALHPDKPMSPKGERDATVMSERYAKTCFLNARELSPEQLQAALELARFAVVNVEKKHDHNPGCVAQTGGIAECYAGRPDRAMELLQKGETDGDDLLRGIDMAFRAVLLTKLGRAQEADPVLANAEQLRRRCPNDAAEVTWWDSEQFNLALEEARRAIGAAAK